MVNKDRDIINNLYNKLCGILEKYCSDDENMLVLNAFEMARNAHDGQLRKSGQPFIIHPLEVAIVLAELRLDKETIIAALLHDVIEDTNISREQIQDNFGKEVLFLVEGVTKIEEISGNIPRTELKSESFRKLLLAMARDVRVIIIKLADRLHNMLTLDFQTTEKQLEISQETLEIYAPIAQRMGISILSTRLEDLALKYLCKKEYYIIEQKIRESSYERNKMWEEISYDVRNNLVMNGIEAEIRPRLKHLFSIYRKLKLATDDVSIDDIYDIYSIDILVRSTKDCYIVLGIIHQIYNPVPGRFKDYIAIPKSNMYQSLHTTLVSKHGGKFEVQIKTYDMEQTAQYGVLSYWKNGLKTVEKDTKKNSQVDKTKWLEQVLEWQLEIKNNNEFMDLIKSDLDLFSKEIYCFTRSGEVRQLPKGSSAIDFAYLIHSDIGNHIDTVLVNGKKVSPQYLLNNGDQIEIFTSEQAEKPNIEWLNYVKTSNAKNKIKKWIKKNELK